MTAILLACSLIHCKLRRQLLVALILFALSKLLCCITLLVGGKRYGLKRAMTGRIKC